jgi:phosphoenolpyruvate carboxykinase (GTP)
VDGQTPAVETPLGLSPVAGGINVDGLDLDERDWEQLFDVDPDAWLAELDDTEAFYATFGDRLPETLSKQLGDIRQRLESARDASA